MVEIKQTKEARDKKTSQPVAGNQQKYNTDYTRYFYTNIERLWQTIEHMGHEINELQAQLRGEY